MATIAGETPYQERQLFVRKATGLVRGWSVRDAFIYSTLSINLITLGLYIFAFAPFIPKGGLLWAIVLSGAYLVFQAVTYASLIAAMPRAGGDYVWISRTLGGGIGFVLAACGWWFILWHWVPIYANILNIQVFGPLSAIIGWHHGVHFWSRAAGGFTSSLIVCAIASVLISLGMRTYARVQKFCFYGGVLGLGVVVVLLLVHSKSDFIAAFNTQAHSIYGTSGDAYHASLAAGTKGYHPAAISSFTVGATLLLIPMIAFFNLWSNWGATLYGEVRGASDFRKNIYAMGGALVATTIAAVILLLLFAKTFGWDFYNAMNNSGGGALASASSCGCTVFPYPMTWVSFFTASPLGQFLIIGILSLWFFGWVGTVFLSSTRVVFATAFDRVLPEWSSRVSANGVPYYALGLMLLPSIPISYFVEYNHSFSTWTLDATLVIAITFLGSAVAAAVLPWRKPEIYNASPIAKYKIGPLPLITAAALAFTGFLVFCLVKWFQDSVYGVNNHDSLIYMGVLYGAALLIYVGSRLYRRRQGIDLKMVYGEIPAE